MSNLSIPIGSAPPSVATVAGKPGFLARLVLARATAAHTRARTYLASQSDVRLARLGFTADDIQALRKGELPMASAR